MATLEINETTIDTKEDIKRVLSKQEDKKQPLYLQPSEGVSSLDHVDQESRQAEWELDDIAQWLCQSILWGQSRKTH